MDFGFMKARLDDKNICSYDGYNCYLLIVDYYTRYTWVFLSRNKQPPIQTVQHFLESYRTKGSIHIIRMDQGGELARSSAFAKAVQSAGYNLETTGADNSSQNSIAERPHQTLANMVRAALENSNVHGRFGSSALLHAVFVKKKKKKTATCGV